MLIRSAIVLALFITSVPAASDKNATYLALGDSIAFGYDPLVPPVPTNFTGYPEIVAQSEVKFTKLTNTSCPGETSASFSSATAPDNGCRGFKAAFGLHTNYTGTQMAEALFLLQTEKVGVVTIDIGGNDLLLLQAKCANQPVCILTGLPAVLTAYGQNLGAILRSLRRDGGYKGQIVLVTIYSPNYQDPVQTGGILALNTVALQTGLLYGVTIADGFTAFAQASAATGGNTCAAGLLIHLPDGTCDVHPSPAGRDLLAKIVVNVVK